MPVWHLTFPTADRMPLFPEEPVRRRAYLRLSRLVGARAVLQSLVDTHLHMAPAGTRAAAGRLSQSVVQCLVKGFGVSIGAADIRRVRDRSHMLWLVRYFLTQLPHHRLPGDPALYSGSCFQDLIGARVIDGFALHRHRAAPADQRGPGRAGQPAEGAGHREAGADPPGRPSAAMGRGVRRPLRRSGRRGQVAPVSPGPGGGDPDRSPSRFLLVRPLAGARDPGPLRSPAGRVVGAEEGARRGACPAGPRGQRRGAGRSRGCQLYRATRAAREK